MQKEKKQWRKPEVKELGKLAAFVNSTSMKSGILVDAIGMGGETMQ